MKRKPALAFTLPELSQRIGIEATVLRIAIANGLLECDQQRRGRQQPWAPVIARDAAIAFCVAVGIDTRRLVA